MPKNGSAWPTAHARMTREAQRSNKTGRKQTAPSRNMTGHQDRQQTHEHSLTLDAGTHPPRGATHTATAHPVLVIKK